MTTAPLLAARAQALPAALVAALLLWLTLGITSVLARRWLTQPRFA